MSKSTSGGAFSIQGTAIVDANGAWNFTFVSATPLPVDGLDLRATQHMRPDGFPTPDSPPSNVVHVAPPVVQCLPGTYSATGNAPCTTASAGYYVATAGATAQVACPVGMTSAAGAVACTPLPAPPAPVFYKPAQNEPVNGLYQVDGGSLNGASVTLTVSVAGNVVETHVFPNTPGGWAMTGLFSPLPISAQGFDLTAVQTVPGNPTPSAPAVVHVTNVMPPPVITSPVNGQVVGEFLFVVRGTGVPHAEVAVSVPGRPSQFPVPVDFDGTWAVSFASAPNNPPGGFDISVAQRPWFPTTVAPWGDQVSVHVTNWAPEPVIVSPVAESTIPGATFQVTGTGVPGDMINVLVNFVTLGINPVVAPDGTWSATVPVPPYSPDGFSLNARQWSPVPDSQGAFSPPIHLMGTAPPPCAPGSFSATGFVPCTPAPAGSYVSAAGATSATPWTVCTPNQYVVTAGTASSDVVCAAKLATTTTVTFGAGPFPAKGSAYTATASVSPTAAGSAAVVYSGDCVNPGTTCKATATFPGSATYASSAASASITIVAVTSGQYRVCTVRGDHDNDEDDDRGGSRARGHESGSTLPVQVRICYANGRNVGSRTLVVKAVGLSPSGVLSDAGKSNPGNLFRFDDGVYTFNLSTKGLAGGTYTLDFTVGSDPTVNHYSFTVRPEKVVPNGGKGDGKGDDKGGH